MKSTARAATKSPFVYIAFCLYVLLLFNFPAAGVSSFYFSPLSLPLCLPPLYCFYYWLRGAVQLTYIDTHSLMQTLKPWRRSTVRTLYPSGGIPLQRWQWTSHFFLSTEIPSTIPSPLALAQFSFYLSLCSLLSPLMSLTCDCLYLYREYGTIDDVDIDLHINISFLDVSGANTCQQHI